MKMVKKAMLLTTTLALGFALTGCKNTSVISKSRIESLSKDEKVEAFKNVNLKKDFTVKYWDVVPSSNRLIWLLTTEDKTIIYDLYSDKIIFETIDEVSSISRWGYSNDFVVITYADEKASKEVITANGDTFLKKDAYTSLSCGLSITTNNRKLDNFRENVYKVTYRAVGDTETKIEYYKVSYPGIKSYNKKIDVNLDTSTYVYSKTTEEEIYKQKAGDKVYKDSKNYTYQTYNNTVVFIDNGSKNVVYTLESSYSYRRILVNGSKAFVQLVNTLSNSQQNYDFSYENNKYNIETYVIDLDRGTKKLLTDFNYYVASDESSIVYGDNCIVINDAKNISNNIITTSNSIVLDKDFKITKETNTYAYCNSTYTDLGNGKMIVLDYNAGLVYLTNKEGKIEKIFIADGYEILTKSKVIVLKGAKELFTIDYKGNYVGEGNYPYTFNYIINDEKIWYRNEVVAKNYLLTFDNKNVTKTEVDYYIDNGDMIAELDDFGVKDNNTYFYCGERFYYTIKLNDVDNDKDYDNYDIEFFTLEGTSINKIEKLVRNAYVGSYHLEDDSFYVNYLGTTLNTDGTYKLSIYKID